MSEDKREIFAKSYAQKMQARKSEPKSCSDDKVLRGREMSEDPMLEYFRQKDKADGSKRKEPPQYRGYYPPNRHNIRPGYRWDGVDRSNGFEKKLVERESKKRAKEEENYRNETRDM